MNQPVIFNTSDAHAIPTRRFKVYTHRQLDDIKALKQLPDEKRFEMTVVANVLPFRVNEYVIDELINWDNVPDDPIFQLTFPQRGMLDPEHFERMANLLRREPSGKEIQALATEIRGELNPHPAGQMQLNIPKMNEEKVEGMQHKYPETVLFFPSQGQVCHSYCTFCFRWAQFVGDKSLRFASNEADKLVQYLKAHTEVSDLLITGGDPMVMKIKNLRGYLDALRDPSLEHIQTVRIGTKSLTFWPHRYVSDDDADEVLFTLESLVKAGKHVAIMAHYNHWHELDTPVAHESIRRIR
ncbi:MAG: lysine 2,3-aminomutase, partial [Pseudomonadota bacterium]